MDLIATALTCSLFGLAAAQMIFVWGFVRCLRNWKRPLLRDADCPTAAVILCLRGSDPFLNDCLHGLVSQDYPNYQVKIIVDHEDDPAKRTAEDCVSSLAGSPGFPTVEILVLAHVETTCSLKCSGLIQAIENLDRDVEIVAQLDADTIPHSTWLRELATALQPKKVGVATGNRWYMPTDPTTGSLVRYAWNAAAVVQMYWYSIAWGGSLAIKSTVIREAGLVERWRTAFCEDTMLLREVGKAGYGVRFVPSLMMINREDCDVKSFFLWVRRQLLTARLYHPFWPAVVGHGLLSTAVPIVSLVWAVSCLLSNQWQLAGVLVASLIAYQLVMTIMLPWMESAVSEIAAGRNEETKWGGNRSTVHLVWIGLMMQWIYTRALVSSLFLRRVDWRGIHYDIDGPWSIAMSAYQPYCPPRKESTHAASL